MYIFNRWGQQIFSSNNINDGWDGMFKGNICPAGSYYYVIHYKGIATPRKTITGTVTIVR